MKLPKLHLEFKLLSFFLFVALVPLVLMNLLFLNYFLSLILADLNKMIFSVMLLIVTVLLIFLLTVWISKHIIDPIKQIHTAFREAGLGNLDTRLAIHTGDEIEDLANGFNDMAESLRRSITSLKRDREVISAERNKFAVVIAGISDAVIAVDLHQNVVIFNATAEKLTELSAQEVLGKPISSIIRIFDEDHELASSDYCPIRTDEFEGVVFNKKNVKLTCVNGKNLYVDLLAGKIKEAISVDLGCILTLHDISKEKSLEEMKLDFVSMAAHELRTPLTSLKGYLSVFKHDNKDMFNDEQMMFINRMEISASQLSSLVENLLSVSRIERGAFTVSTEMLDWVETVKEAVNEIVDRAKDKKLELEFTEPDEPIPNVAADKLRMNEVLINLLANAVSYTQPGGTITVWVEQRGNEVVTHVKDTGQGIPQEALPHLFIKFFRVSGVLESGSKGTGLGLYISKAIVEMHHGKIWAESEVGRGSTFSFSLPAVPSEQQSLGKNDHEELTGAPMHG